MVKNAVKENPILQVKSIPETGGDTDAANYAIDLDLAW